MFETLGEGAVIKDVSFTGVVYEFTSVSTTANSYKVAALAINATGATVSGVTISGVVNTNCDASNLAKADSAFYEDTDGANTVTDLIVNVTVEVTA